jgi:hypothetical protein
VFRLQSNAIYAASQLAARVAGEATIGRPPCLYALETRHTDPGHVHTRVHQTYLEEVVCRIARVCLHFFSYFFLLVQRLYALHHPYVSQGDVHHHSSSACTRVRRGRWVPTRVARQGEAPDTTTGASEKTTKLNPRRTINYLTRTTNLLTRHARGN